MRKDGELESILRKAKLWDARQTEPPPAIGAQITKFRRFDGTMFWQFVEAAFVTSRIEPDATTVQRRVGLILHDQGGK